MPPKRTGKPISAAVAGFAARPTPTPQVAAETSAAPVPRHPDRTVKANPAPQLSAVPDSAGRCFCLPCRPSRSVAGRGVFRSKDAGLRVTVAWVISFLATRSPLISGKHLPGITNDARSPPAQSHRYVSCGPRLRSMWALVTFLLGHRSTRCGPRLRNVGHDYGETKNAAHLATQSRPTSHRNQRPTSNGITGPLGPESACHVLPLAFTS